MTLSGTGYQNCNRISFYAKHNTIVKGISVCYKWIDNLNNNHYVNFKCSVCFLFLDNEIISWKSNLEFNRVEQLFVSWVIFSCC